MEAAYGSDLKPRFYIQIPTVVLVTAVTKLSFHGFRHHALEQLHYHLP